MWIQKILKKTDVQEISDGYLRFTCDDELLATIISLQMGMCISYLIRIEAIYQVS